MAIFTIANINHKHEWIHFNRQMIIWPVNLSLKSKVLFEGSLAAYPPSQPKHASMYWITFLFFMILSPCIRTELQSYLVKMFVRLIWDICVCCKPHTWQWSHVLFSNSRGHRKKHRTSMKSYCSTGSAVVFYLWLLSISVISVTTVYSLPFYKNVF